MRTNEPPLWLPLLLLFRLGFRFVTLLDPVLGMVLFYNAPLMLHFPRIVVLCYPLIMGIIEAYLVVALRRGQFPFGLILTYFMAAIVFEFPYAAVESGESGILLLPLMGYITAPAGLLLVLTSHRPWKTP
ncbi:hypothetical protein [Thermococcus sp.]|uniref:hypothetical protein n=1 Tax=Thermococcus sp. TaxID=35749 RepID=UPI0025FDF9E2|nr:hypothetical protein [Thermococcus sp.]